MEKKIVIVGSANIDMVVKSDRFPKVGETILGGDFYMLPGGKGANQAVAAARLGGNVHFMCRIGDDTFGRRCLKAYKEENISTDYIVTDPENPTGIALISVNGDGENKIIVAPGANYQFTQQEIEQSRDLFSKADIIVLQLEIPLQTIGQILTLAKESETKVILNPAPAQPLPEWFYDGLYLITPNETEAEQLTGITINGEDAALQAANRFQAMGVENIVITRGAQGACVVIEEYTGLIRAPEVNAEDTTAAGDIFNGALAVALSRCKPMKSAVQFACSAAAVSVSKIGAQRSAPILDELRAFFPDLKESIHS